MEPIVQDGGADLKSSMRAARGPAHLSTLVHPGDDQGVHEAFGARRRDWLSLPPPPAGCHGSLGALYPPSRTGRPCRHPDHDGHLQRRQWCSRGGRLDRRCDRRPFRHNRRRWGVRRWHSVRDHQDWWQLRCCSPASKAFPERPSWLVGPTQRAHAPTMFVVTESEAAAIRAVYEQRDEFAVAIELEVG